MSTVIQNKTHSPNAEGICELETPPVIDAIKHRRQTPLSRAYAAKRIFNR
jgi:hypothetical protein